MQKFLSYRILLWTCLILIIFSKNVSAQTGDSLRTHLLKEITVEGKKQVSATRSTAPVQTISQEQIQRLGLQDVSDAVKRFSGVSVKDYGGIGGLKTVSIRSLGAQHTAVSYDGVTISDCQSGQVDISRFSLDNIASLSLFIGQTDDIFQTARMFASAGALNITTARPDFSERNSHLQFQVKSGSFGFVNPLLRYSQKLSKRWGISTDIDWMRADSRYPYTLKNGNLTTHEKRKNSDIEAWRTELNLYGKIGKTGNLDFKAYYFDSERGLPGSVVLYNPYSGERLWDRNFFSQARYENRFNKTLSLQLQARYNYSYTRYVDINNKYESGKQTDRHTQQEYYGSGTLLYSPFEGFSCSLATDLAVNRLENNFLDCSYPKRYTSLTALSAQYRHRFLTVTATLLGTYATEKVKSGDTPEDRKKLSPSVSLSLRPWSDRNLYFRLMYKNIFRVPTFNDLYYLRMGNRDLVPESATQYNAGITWSGIPFSFMDYFNISVDGYYNRVKDKIVARPTLFVWRMMNMGEVEITGADVNIATAIPLSSRIRMQITAAYTYQKAIDITDSGAKNYRDQIPYTPEHAGSASVSVENPWVNASYTLMAVGKRYALPQNIEMNRIDGYAEHTLSFSREFTLKKCRVRLQGDIVNLTDKQYDVIQYYPMPGRSYRFTGSIRF